MAPMPVITTLTRSSATGDAPDTSIIHAAGALRSLNSRWSRRRQFGVYLGFDAEHRFTDLGGQKERTGGQH